MLILLYGIMLSTAFANSFSTEIGVELYSNGKKDGAIEVWHISCFHDSCDLDQIRFAGGFIFITSNTLRKDSNSDYNIENIDYKKNTLTFKTQHYGGTKLSCFLAAKEKLDSGAKVFKCAGIRTGLITTSADNIEMRPIKGMADLKNLIKPTQIFGVD